MLASIIVMLMFLLFSLFLAVANATNILMLMCDQLRFDAALGGSGSTPTCTPARAALLTGQSPWNHGMLGYGVIWHKYDYEMPRALKDAGYTTASIGKDHFGWNRSLDEGIPHGYESTNLYDGLGTGFANSTEFDNYDQWFQKEMPGKSPLATGLGWNEWKGKPYVYDEYYHPTAWVGRAAVDYLKKYSEHKTRQTSVQSDTKPFFLKVSFHRPHSPYDPPAKYLDMTPASMLPPLEHGDQWDTRFMGPGAGLPRGCGGISAWCGKMPAENVTYSRRCYYANIHFIDDWIGQIMDTLKQLQLLEDTFIIFTADHGDMQNDHYHWRKGFPYEGSAHVPMIVRWPANMQSVKGKPVKATRGSHTELVGELRDVFPTFLDVAQAPPPPSDVLPLKGRSMACLLTDLSGESCDWHKWMDLEHDICYNETNHWNSLTDGKMKYIYRAYFGDEQLFNITADPWEHHDVASQPAYNNELKLWRSRMVAQFEQEGRGPTWVKDGVLQRRVKGQLYSPNYPGYHKRELYIPNHYP